MKIITPEFKYAKFYYLENLKGQSLIVVLSPDPKVKRKKIIHAKNYIYCSDRTFDETIHSLCVDGGYVIKGGFYFPFKYGVNYNMWVAKNTTQQIVPRKYPLKYTMTKNDSTIEYLYNLETISLYKYGGKNIIIIGDLHEGHFNKPPPKRGMMKIDHFCRNLIDIYDDISFVCEGTMIASGFHGEQESMLSLFNIPAMSVRINQSILLVKNINFPYVDIRSEADEKGIYKILFEKHEIKKVQKKSFSFLKASKDFPYHPFRAEAIKLIKSRELLDASSVQCANVDAFILLAIAYSKNKNILVHAGRFHTKNVESVLKKYTCDDMSLTSRKISKEKITKNFPWRNSHYLVDHIIKLNPQQSSMLTSFFN